jgi:hypothetical protein
VPADAGDLACAVRAALDELRQSPAVLAMHAGSQGWRAEEVEAAFLVGLFFEWLCRQGDSHGLEARLAALDGEAERVAVAAEECRPVAMGVRLPPALALRVLELALLRERSADAVLRELVGGAVDAAFAAESKKAGRPAPRPWQG